MSVFKGEVRTVEELHSCPLCGKKAVIRKNSSKQFQVYCSCGYKTIWEKKDEAIIDWYNGVIELKYKRKRR